MRRLAASFAVLAAALAACSSVDKTGIASRGFYSPDFDTVWEVAEREMQREGFVPDRTASSKENKTMVSRWAMSLQPFSSRGYREQATLTFREVPNAPKRYTVEVNVLRELNSQITQPGNPIVAEWEDGVRVYEKEALIARRIETFFIPKDVSPEFRARYGMDPLPRQPWEEEEKPAAPIGSTPNPR
jgi:hypothetical protein